MVYRPLATDPAIASTASTTHVMPTAGRADVFRVSTIASSAPQIPIVTATGTDMASPSGHMLTGHG